MDGRDAEVTGGLRLRLFGGWEAQNNGKPLTALAERRGDEVLAYLLLHHGRAVPMSEAAASVWEEEARVGNQDAAEHRLRQCLTTLRQNLGAEQARITVAHRAVSFDAQGADIDLVAFDQAAEHALIAPAAADFSAMAAGVLRYERGKLLDGWEQTWVVEARRKRREQYAAALESLAKRAAHIALPYQQAQFLLKLVRLRPGQESLWHDLLAALLDAGERLQAVEVARLCVKYYEEHALRLPASTLALIDRASAVRTDHPAAPPELESVEPVGGAVPLNSRFYVERAADALFYAALARREGIVLVKGPRQNGKTSLLARGLHRARQAGSRVLLIDMQKLSEDDLLSDTHFYRALARLLTEQLDLNGSPDKECSPNRSANAGFNRFVRRLLEEVGGPLVFALDEVDRLFSYPYRDNVFGLFRAWHNERALDSEGPFQRLTLALAYATEPHLFISDLNRSPFNVGTRVALDDLTREQVAELNRRHASPLTEPDGVNQLIGLVGGHPYLVRLALYEATVRQLSLEKMEAEATRGIGPFAQHLDRMMLSLDQDSSGLIDALRQILQGKSCEDKAFVRLLAAGVVTAEAEDEVRLRCRLYRDYLQRRLA